MVTLLVGTVPILEDSGLRLTKKPAAFRPHLTDGLALSGLNSLFLDFFLFREPLKNLSQRGDLKLLMDLTYRRKILSCIVEILKVFLHLPPPLEGDTCI